MQEGAPKQEKEKQKGTRSNFAEAAFLSVGILAAHPEAKALEMDQYTPWHIAVQDNIRDAVKKDKVEHATTYVYYTDRSGEWVAKWQGELGSVKNQPIDDLEDAKKVMRGREIAAMCHIHIHQEEIFKQLFKGIKAKYNPPSAQDILYARGTTYNYRVSGMKPAVARFAVADPQGIWYFGPASKTMNWSLDQIKTLANATALHDVMNKEVSSFITESAKSDFNFEKKYSALRKAYQTTLSGEARFVPYGKITEEPPCAGVHYKH